MSNLLTLINDLGEDADLLTRSDEWLEQERRMAATELDRIITELRVLQTAQRIKAALQQRNLVAVQKILRSSSGEIVDIIVQIMNLPDSMSLLTAEPQDTLDKINTAAQLHGWDRDGYDLKTSKALRAPG